MLTCGTGTCNKSAVDTQIPILFDAGWGKVPAFFTWHTADDEKRAAPFVVLDRFHLAIAIVRA